MKSEAKILRRAQRMSPLLRSIVREARDRSSGIQLLEAKLEGLLAGPGEPVHEIRRVEEELFRHRRGFESLQAELARLGCSLDANRPDRIVCSMADHDVSFEDRSSPRG